MKARLKRRQGPVWVRAGYDRWTATMPDGVVVIVARYGGNWRWLIRYGAQAGRSARTAHRSVKARRPGCSMRRSAMLVAIEMWKEKQK